MPGTRYRNRTGICLAVTGTILLTVLAPTPSTACIFYRDYLHPVSLTVMNDDAGDLEVVGDRAYFAGAYGNFEVVDLSTPSAPDVIGSTSIPANCFYLDIDADLAGLGCSYSGLRFIDISNPAAPTVVSSFLLPDHARGVALRNGLAYAAASNAGLHVLDVSDPSDPQAIGSVALSGFALGVFVHGDLAFVAMSGGLLNVVDISSATAPVLLGSVALPDLASRIEFADGLAYIACNGAGLLILDLSDPVAPVTIGSLATAPEFARDLAVRDGMVYLAAWEQQMIWNFGGVRVIDATDPAAPVVVGSMETAQGAEVVALGENVLAVGDRWSGLAVLNIVNPISPSQSSSLPVAGCMQTAYENNRVCATSDYFGLTVVDLGFASEPEIVAVFQPATGQTKDVAMRDGLAYLACHDGGLQIVDATQPGELALYSSATTSALVDHVALTGNLALLTGSYHTLDVVDISDPTAPVLVGSVDTEGSNWGLAAGGDLAVISGSYLVVVDIGDPTNPVVLAEVEQPTTAMGAALLGNLVCLTCEREVRIYDLTVPTAPVLVSTVATPGESRDIALDERYAYVTDGYGGIQILDLADPPTAYWYGTNDTEGYAWGVSVGAGQIFVADQESFLRILSAQCPLPTAATDRPPAAGSALLLNVSPNPFNPRTVVSFDLPAASTTQLELYDLSGRLVETLVSGELNAGTHSLTWDGTDRSGRPVAAGVYLVRLQAGGLSARQKVMLIR